MDKRTSPPVDPLPGSSEEAEELDAGEAGSTDSPQGVPGPVSGAGIVDVLQPPHQPGIGLERDAQAPNVQQVEEVSMQQAPHAKVGDGEGNPPGVVTQEMAQAMLPPHILRALGQMGLNPATQLMPMDQWTQSYAAQGLPQNPGLRQPSLQLPQQQQPQQGVQVAPQAAQLAGLVPGRITGIYCAAGGSGSGLQRETLLQLLEILKSPNTPENQQQILQILKSSPLLLAEFIKRRSAYQAREQQQQQLAATAEGVAAQQETAVIDAKTGVLRTGLQQQVQHLMAQQEQEEFAEFILQLLQAMLGQTMLDVLQHSHKKP